LLHGDGRPVGGAPSTGRYAPTVVSVSLPGSSAAASPTTAPSTSGATYEVAMASRLRQRGRLR
jgi:hypothetical protein